jgi:hypothetical protein
MRSFNYCIRPLQLFKFWIKIQKQIQTILSTVFQFIYKQNWSFLMLAAALFPRVWSSYLEFFGLLYFILCKIRIKILTQNRVTRSGTGLHYDSGSLKAKSFFEF